MVDSKAMSLAFLSSLFNYSLETLLNFLLCLLFCSARIARKEDEEELRKIEEEERRERLRKESKKRKMMVR